MKIEEFKMWDIEPFEGCEIQCPDCKEWSSHIKWTEGDVYCEDCGTHSAIRCPECFEYFDHVWGPHFEVRKPNL